MTQANPPAGWYPQGSQERYWDGSSWTAHVRPLSTTSGGHHPAAPYQAGAHATGTYPPGTYASDEPGVDPPKSNTLRNVLLGVGLLVILLVGGCAVLVGVAYDQVSDAIETELAGQEPLVVTEGESFEYDGFEIAEGWSVGPDEIGRLTITDMTVTLVDDDGFGDGDSAHLTFRLFEESLIVDGISCSSNEVYEGESSAMDCYGGDPGSSRTWDTIKVSSTW